MDKVVTELARHLNREKILWGIGGSLLLKSYDIVQEAHDIDILVAREDVKKVIEILDVIATRQIIPIKSEYKTEHFHVYMFEGISIDIMSDFRISHERGTYEFVFDKASIVKFEERDQTLIPYTSLEDWLVAYSLMTRREEKVRMIETYLLENGLLHPQLLRRTLDQDLPEVTKSLVESLLKSNK